VSCWHDAPVLSESAGESSGAAGLIHLLSELWTYFFGNDVQLALPVFEVMRLDAADQRLQSRRLIFFQDGGHAGRAAVDMAHGFLTGGRRNVEHEVRRQQRRRAITGFFM
jgi:hypothetical protein